MAYLPRVLFQQNKFYENVWDRVFVFQFFQTLKKIFTFFRKKCSFFLNFFLPTVKNGLSIERPPALLCACILYWSMCSTALSGAFDKVYEGNI